ncbi:MAG: LON peptidase substrate-binding domain-containing protein, partial [Actinomycetota bacterium]|nr:LON peptidase substrate-binding domain-containing protein [Actinomycetota bacterium]
MAESLTLPVLPLDDTVLLPGMVVPIRMAGTDGTEVRAAVEAA